MSIQLRYMQAEADYRRDRISAEFEAQKAKDEARRIRRRHVFGRRHHATENAADRLTIAVR
jgi:hypothetical protein